MRIATAQQPSESPTAQRGGDSHQGMVGASGPRRPLIIEVIQSPRRWMVKHFRSQEAQNKWIEENKHQLQIVPLFVDNGYAVEFRKLLQP